jgi:DMSO/TMAO reductase YedYZ molybdopterin-dependent catalytic subunit
MSDDDDSLHDAAKAPPTKLTATKQKWAREGKFITGHSARPEAERLPPGQHLVKDWPVLNLGEQPNVDKRFWRLDVVGAVANPVSWDWAAFTAQPQAKIVTDIHCVTTWSRYDNAWDGMLTRDLLAAVMPLENAAFVLLQSYDGYTTNLPLKDFAASDAMLVHGWQGAPLSVEHGGPLRLVVPHLYFWKSAKWIKQIEFASKDHPGFWEDRGYHMRGDPWREERYSE